MTSDATSADNFSSQKGQQADVPLREKPNPATSQHPNPSTLAHPRSPPAPFIPRTALLPPPAAARPAPPRPARPPAAAAARAPPAAPWPHRTAPHRSALRRSSRRPARGLSSARVCRACPRLRGAEVGAGLAAPQPPDRTLGAAFSSGCPRPLCFFQWIRPFCVLPALFCSHLSKAKGCLVRKNNRM